MSLECYAIAKNCPDCTKFCINLWSGSSQLKRFPALAPLDYVLIDSVEELLHTMRKHRCRLAIADRSSKKIRTAPVQRITFEAVAQAFISYYLLVYGPLLRILFDICR